MVTKSAERNRAEKQGPGRAEPTPAASGGLPSPEPSPSGGGPTAPGEVPKGGAVSETLKDEKQGPTEFQTDLPGLVQWFSHLRDYMPPWEYDSYVSGVALDLYAAGILRGELSDVVTASGELTPTFYAALKNFFDLQVGLKAAGHKGATELSWREYLDKIGGEPDEETVNEFMGGEGGGGDSPISITLSSAKNLELNLENTYKQMVGKAPSRDEKRAFIAAIHRAQKVQQTAMQRMKVDTQMEAVDVGAEAVMFARNERPVEVASKEVAGAGQVLRGMVQ